MDALLASLFVATAAFVLLGCSWSREERMWALRAVAAELRLIARAARVATRGLLNACVQDRDAGASVTLGEVSEMIDVVRLGLSAGLSFDASLELYCSQRHSVLAARLSQAMLAWRVGAGTREEELVRAARELDVKALDSFAIAVAQTLALGAPLADVLAVQGREIRASHRAQVEREIERAPVKLLIPTGALILPALLLSILGPLMAASGMV